MTDEGNHYSAVALDNTPLAWAMKRLGLVNHLHAISAPRFAELHQRRPSLPFLGKAQFVFVTNDGAEWLVYLRMFYQRLSPSMVHIGVPTLPRISCQQQNGFANPFPFSYYTASLANLSSLINFLSVGKARFQKRIPVTEFERHFVFQAIGWREILKARGIVEHRTRSQLEEELAHLIRESKGMTFWEELINYVCDDARSESYLKYRGIINSIFRTFFRTGKS